MFVLIFFALIGAVFSAPLDDAHLTPGEEQRDWPLQEENRKETVLPNELETIKEPELPKEHLIFSQHHIELELPAGDPEIPIPPKTDLDITLIEEPRDPNHALIEEPRPTRKPELLHVASWPIMRPFSLELFLLNAVHAPEFLETARRA